MTDEEKIVQLHQVENDYMESAKRLKSGGGGGTSGGMEARLAKLEARVDGVEKRLDDIKSDIGRVESRLISLGETQLSKWDVAQVVFFVMAALMAAVVFGPRLTSLL